MKHENREQAAKKLLAARGWIECFLPLLQDPPPADTMIEVRSGNIVQAVEKIDDVLELLGHTGGGSCKGKI